jgi:hypothetical protein
MNNREVKRCFLNIDFIKSNLRNKLITHLDLVVKMFVFFLFTLNTLLFVATICAFGMLQNHVMGQKHRSSNNKFLNPNLFFSCILCCSCVFMNNVIFIVWFIWIKFAMLCWLVWSPCMHVISIFANWNSLALFLLIKVDLRAQNII